MLTLPTTNLILVPSEDSDTGTCDTILLQSLLQYYHSYIITRVSLRINLSVNLTLASSADRIKSVPYWQLPTPPWPMILLPSYVPLNGIGSCFLEHHQCVNLTKPALQCHIRNCKCHETKECQNLPLLNGIGFCFRTHSPPVCAFTTTNGINFLMCAQSRR